MKGGFSLSVDNDSVVHRGLSTLSSMWEPTSFHWLEPRTLWVPIAISSVRSRVLMMQTVMGTVVSHGLWDLAVLSA